MSAASASLRDAGPSPRVGSEAPARISRLSLSDFRSYARASIAFDGRPVAMAGPNGAGKTNVLEALSLLGPGRGLRHARLIDLAREGGEGGWAVSARLDDGEDERALGVGAAPDRADRRICRIDGREASGPGALAAHLRLIWLTPAQDRLFLDGAGERRRFLDRLRAAHDPDHGRLASDYERAMRQRQRLLEGGRADAVWLDAIERRMAETGVAVAAGRCEMAETLAANAVDCAAFPAADLSVEGFLESALDADAALAVEDAFVERLRAGRAGDREAGRARIGPHKSDLLVRHREKDRPARLASTGEQKAILIGLVLASARALRHAREAGFRAPLILLLDEVAAHLDPDRRAALFDIIESLPFQTFMTGTDRHLFAAWGARAQHVAVAGGSLENSV